MRYNERAERLVKELASLGVPSPPPDMSNWWQHQLDTMLDQYKTACEDLCKALASGDKALRNASRILDDHSTEVAALIQERPAPVEDLIERYVIPNAREMDELVAGLQLRVDAEIYTVLRHLTHHLSDALEDAKKAVRTCHRPGTFEALAVTAAGSSTPAHASDGDSPDAGHDPMDMDDDDDSDDNNASTPRDDDDATDSTKGTPTDDDALPARLAEHHRLVFGAHTAFRASVRTLFTRRPYILETARQLDCARRGVGSRRTAQQHRSNIAGVYFDLAERDAQGYGPAAGDLFLGGETSWRYLATACREMQGALAGEKCGELMALVGVLELVGGKEIVWVVDGH